MDSFRSGRLRPRPSTPAPSEEDVIRHAAQVMEQARRARDEAIATATNTRLRTIAEAAGISHARVKQIRRGGRPAERSSDLLRPPITEVDLYLADHVLEEGDRILSLHQVNPWVQQYASEREYLQQTEGIDGPDFGSNYYDTDPTQPYVVSSRGTTKGLMIYAFAQNTGPLDDSAPPVHDEHGFHGSSAGPCYPLGILPSEDVADAAVFNHTGRISRRLGALAWLYGRIQTVNTILAATVSHFDPLFEPTPELLAYLQPNRGLSMISTTAGNGPR